MKKALVTTALIFASILVMSGCEQQGPAEKAGEQIDEAVESAGEKIEEAGDKIRENTQ